MEHTRLSKHFTLEEFVKVHNGVGSAVHFGKLIR